MASRATYKRIVSQAIEECGSGSGTYCGPIDLDFVQRGYLPFPGSDPHSVRLTRERLIR